MLHFLLTSITSIVGGALGALALIGLAPAKIFDYFIKKKLAEKIHRQDVEIEKIKSHLSHLSDRGLKSNEQEFLSLSAVWKAYVEAHEATFLCASEFVRYPRLIAMSEEEVASFLDDVGLSDKQKQNVLKSENRERAYADQKLWNDTINCKISIVEFRKQLRVGAVFIPENIYVSLEKDLSDMTAVCVHREMSVGRTAPLGCEVIQKWFEKSDQNFKDKQILVRNRLLCVFPDFA